MDSAYSHTQRSRALAILCIVSVVLILAPVAIIPQPVPRGVWVAVGLAALMMVIMAWEFSSLTVEIANDELSWRFGAGIIRKRLPLSEIASAVPIRTGIWQGIGVHWVGAGWLYNVAMGDAVEITTLRGKRIRIGTDEPVALANAIERVARARGR